MKRAAPWILLLFALCYYGSYYRCGLYPSGEGGVEGVTALRLISGKIPIIDVSLNYNLLWFYPIVGLFKIFGPSYTVIRVFFFALATITGLLSFEVVKMTTRRTWLAFVAGILTLLLPGQLFRNYMAFIVLLNMATFLKAMALPCRSQLRRLAWMLAAGLSLGLSFLLRLDLGFFLSVILLGLIALYPWIDSLREDAITSLKRRWLMTAAALFLAVTGFAALHLPVYNDAVQRGFAPQFVTQYQQWPHMIVSQGRGLLKNLSPRSTAAVRSIVAPEQAASKSEKLNTSTSTSHLSHEAAEKSTLTRRSFFSSDIREQLMACNLYLPILCALLLGLMMFGFLFLGRKNENRIYPHRAIILLTCLGCTLTLFPQYFFWRPDMVHLSEFMVPMTVTLLIAANFSWEAWKHNLSSQSTAAAKGFVAPVLAPSSTLSTLTCCAPSAPCPSSPAATVKTDSPIRSCFHLTILLFFICASITLLFYFINGCQSQSTGGIAISQGRTKEFVGANGVRVKLTPQEFQEATAISQSILQHSNPEDYVICYPYNPEINFMTDRPSYRRDLYIDDVTAPKDFDQTTIAEIEHYHPAVIVVTDWPINGTEHSRFTNWAAETYRYIQSHYRADYEQGIIHVFVRPETR